MGFSIRQSDAQIPNVVKTLCDVNGTTANCQLIGFDPGRPPEAQILFRIPPSIYQTTICAGEDSLRPPPAGQIRLYFGGRLGPFLLWSASQQHRPASAGYCAFSASRLIEAPQSQQASLGSRIRLAMACYLFKLHLRPHYPPPGQLTRIAARSTDRERGPAPTAFRPMVFLFRTGRLRMPS